MCIWPQLFLTFKQSVLEAKVSEKRKHYLLPTKLGLLDLEATFAASHGERTRGLVVPGRCR